jgi:hypothetical protein
MGSASRRHQTFLPAVLAAAVASAPASALADCSRGTRPSTQTERRFQVDTLKAVRAAMPLAPAGWRIIEETEVRPPRLACIGQERQPLPIEYRIRFAEPDAQVSELTVRVNARRQAVPALREAVDSVSGALAFRGRDAAADAVHVLIGDWSLDSGDGDDPAHGEALAHFVADLPHTQAQSLAVRIDGRQGRAELLLAGLNVRALAALVR